MCKKHLKYLIFICFSYYTFAFAADEDFINPMRAASASGITVYSSTLSNAPAALARTYITGGTQAKGIIGESIASKNFLQTSLEKTGNWHSISPRIGPQGIDHIFLKIDPETALPKGMIVGESKYNTSRLGKTANDGLQLSSRWTNRRLHAMGTRYYQISNVTTIQEAPTLGGNHEMKVVLKNGKEVYFWRSNSKDVWKFSGKKSELQEAQRIARAYGQYLSAAGEGKIIYRSRLFQIVPKGNDIVISIKDASKLDIVQKASKLPETQRITLNNVLSRKAPKDVEREITKSLRGKFPGYSEKELTNLAKKINSSAQRMLSPYTKIDMLGTFAIHSGITAIIAGIADASLQYFTTGNVDAERLAFTSGTVFVGTMGAQFIEVGLSQWCVSQEIFRNLGQSLSCSSSLLGSTFSSATGGLFVGLLFSYGSWYMGYVDLTTANRMAAASSIGTGVGMLAGWGTIAAISAWGTASTGTAIASLGGAAATNATLAALGGGSLAAGGGGAVVGSVVLTGGVAIIAIAATGAVLIIYDLYDKKQEEKRITKFSELLRKTSTLDLMIKNSSISF